jgi:hypothetical protein
MLFRKMLKINKLQLSLARLHQDRVAVQDISGNSEESGVRVKLDPWRVFIGSWQLALEENLDSVARWRNLAITVQPPGNQPLSGSEFITQDTVIKIHSRKWIFLSEDKTYPGDSILILIIDSQALFKIDLVIRL